MKKLRIVVIILAIVLIISAGVITVCFVSGANSSSSTSVSPQPSVAPFPGSSAVATVYQTLAPGTDAFVGSWHGSTSLFFGMATADYSLVARPDGTMTLSGIADAPIAGVEKMPFSVDATWIHLSGLTYKGTIGDKSMEFICDGSKILLTVNPYTAGLVDYEILNMDIDFALTRG